MTGFRAAFCAALLLFELVHPAHAQDVTLTSPDGAVELTGTLLGFDGEFYRVKTQFGELTVDGSGVLCDGPGCPSLADYVAEVDFSGSSTMAEVLLPALVQGFARRNGYQARREVLDDTHFQYVILPAEGDNPLARFTFRVTNTDEGFADLLADEADIVLALREIRPKERSRARDAGMGDMTGPNRSRVLALDALVPIVTPANPVQRISTEDLAAVLAGEIDNWSALGGPDAPIAVHLPEAASGMAQAIEDQLMAPGGQAIADQVIRHKRGSKLADAVVSDPFALGIASFAETGRGRMLTLTGSCGFSLTASRLTIKTEDYPLTAPMFLYLPARRLPKLARAFLAYTTSPGAQIVIRRAGLVDQMPERIGVNQQGDRLANAISAAGEETTLDQLQRMMRVLGPKERLTISFRFETGSSRPDAQSRTNIALLAQDIEAGVYDGRRLIFAGFSDGEGAASGNLRIARTRAEGVRNRVLEAAQTARQNEVKTTVHAFGEALPMACDDTDWGRKVNRRVEIWVE